MDRMHAVIYGYFYIVYRLYDESSSSHASGMVWGLGYRRNDARTLNCTGRNLEKSIATYPPSSVMEIVLELLLLVATFPR